MLHERFHYLWRIASAYLSPRRSQLSFWHEVPELNCQSSRSQLGEYYMTFAAKADYRGHHDSNGIPLLDYCGSIGLRYNPISIAQWGIGNYNLFARYRRPEHRRKFLRASDWLLKNLEQNASGMWVWNHYFDWEYRARLQAPWYSGLAQAQGISLLLRTHREIGSPVFFEAAQKAFLSLTRSIDQGGVTFTDAHGNLWIEEYIVNPPTHILNGFMWAMWGVYDYLLVTGDRRAETLFQATLATLRNNLEDYDLGFWSLYEQSNTSLPMVASPFYHHLHIVQLRVMHWLTGEELFLRVADRWEGYRCSRGK
ncbi:MAG: hypothetical protein JO166_14650, partial [Deltaproteobacteria bacterium]|nr:hypothetical protein [Deltaproteobacteria bacterium]